MVFSRIDIRAACFIRLVLHTELFGQSGNSATRWGAGYMCHGRALILHTILLLVAWCNVCGVSVAEPLSLQGSSRDVVQSSHSHMVLVDHLHIVGFAPHDGLSADEPCMRVKYHQPTMLVLGVCLHIFPGLGLEILTSPHDRAVQAACEGRVCASELRMTKSEYDTGRCHQHPSSHFGTSAPDPPLLLQA